jgi:hypothetical protein
MSEMNQQEARDVVGGVTDVPGELGSDAALQEGLVEEELADAGEEAAPDGDVATDDEALGLDDDDNYVAED